MDFTLERVANGDQPVNLNPFGAASTIPISRCFFRLPVGEPPRSFSDVTQYYLFHLAIPRQDQSASTSAYLQQPGTTSPIAQVLPERGIMNFVPKSQIDWNVALLLPSI